MGSGHELQIDGIGGGHPQTSKVAIVSRSARPDADVDYLFAQVGVAAALGWVLSGVRCACAAGAANKASDARTANSERTLRMGTSG